MLQEPSDGRISDPLERAKVFLDKAAECMRLAQLADSAETRQSYIQLARSYERMSEDMEFVHARRQKWVRTKPTS